jgi:hypothetical protein
MCYEFSCDLNTLYYVSGVYIHLDMGVFDFDKPPQIDSWTSKLALALFTCILDVMRGDVALVHCKKYPEPCVYPLERPFPIVPCLGFVGVADVERLCRMTPAWERSLAGYKFTLIYITLCRKPCLVKP